MKNLFIASATLVILTVLLLACSNDSQLTSPNNSINLAPDIQSGLVDVLISFEKTIPETAINTVGGNIKHQYRNFPIVFASVPVNAIEKLERNPNINFIEKDSEKFFHVQTLDWGIDRVDAEYVHSNSSFNGSGINVGVLDSGGDIDHPDITWAGGYSATSKNPDNWDDKNGHGTHVAGIISANNNLVGVVGVAPNCNIYAIQVGGQRLLISNIIKGLDWVAGTYSDGNPNNDIQVVNMSFGGGNSSAEEAALQTIYNLGVLLVSSAGNSSGSVNYPAAYSFVMAISASTSSEGFASYSNSGSEVELIAPGSSIYSTYKGGGYRTLSGTSMSSPMVAGAAALAWSANPGYSRDQIRNLLKSSAEDVGLTSNQQGFGLVDAEKATLNSSSGDNYTGGPDPNPDPTSGSMHVSSIDFSNNRRNLSIFVKVHDDAHSDPVAGATVSMTLHHVGGSDYIFRGSTNTDGQIKFTLRGISSGLCFDAMVTEVTKSGWSYDNSSNHETIDSYCIP
jgi:subtilisin